MKPPVEAFIDAGLCGSEVSSHAAFARLVLGWDWKTAMWVGITFNGFDLTPERARTMAALEQSPERGLTE